MSLFSLTPALLSHISSHPLESDWPIFDKAEVSSSILEKIRIEANGSSISSYLDYLSLGTFLISTTLLKLHPTQRLIIKSHVNTVPFWIVRPGVWPVTTWTNLYYRPDAMWHGTWAKIRPISTTNWQTQSCRNFFQDLKSVLVYILIFNED